MKLLFEHFELLADAPNSVPKLRELILQLAVQGKLALQDPNNEPASELLKRIRVEKERLIAEGKIKEEKPLESVGEEEIPYQTPNSWQWCHLVEIAQNIHYGYTASADPNKTDVRLLRITDIQNGSVNWNTVPGCEIKEKEVPNYELHKNDILIARTGGTIGKSYLVTDLNVRAVFASYLIRVIPSSLVDAVFLKIFLESPLYWRQLYGFSMGTGQPNVNGTSLRRLITPLPPLPEQKRIVAKVEQLMALCDELEQKQAQRSQKRIHLNNAALNKLLSVPGPEEFRKHWQRIASNFELLYNVPETVTQLKQAILQLAVQGKLVKQNADDEPASELLKRIQAGKERLITEGKIKKEKPLPPVSEEEIPYQLPEGWVWGRFGDLVKKMGAGSTPKGGKSSYVAEGIKFLRSQNVWNDGLNLECVALIPLETHNRMNGTHVHAKDILLNITGASIGRSAIVPDEFDTANVSQHVAILRLIDLRLRNFIHKVIISDYFQKTIMDVQVGISREGLSMTRLREFLMPIPPLNEQKRIVAKVEELLNLCNALEEQLTRARQKSERLMAAVVNQAINEGKD